MALAPEFITTAHIYKRNETMLAKALEGFAGEQWLCRPQDSSNSDLWILGHITWARSRALKLLGVSWTAPWLVYFERGSKPEDASHYPSCDEVLAAWKELCAALEPALETASREAMAAPAQTPSPSFDGTVGGLVSFLAMHESLHLGQIVYLRRLLGIDRIAG
jgi:hypothetical protein